MVSHNWGDEDVDWLAINNCIVDMWWWSRKIGRMGGDIKEKYGTVRFYAQFGYLSLHSLIYPGYAYSQFPKWLWRLDCRYIRPVLQFFFERLFSWYHRKFYSWLYHRMIKKYPQIEAEILSDSDYPEFIDGHFRREGRELHILDSKGNIVTTWTTGGSIEELFKETSKLLAEGTFCPACNKTAQPPLANLGEKYNWMEGHPECLTLTENK